MYCYIIHATIPTASFNSCTTYLHEGRSYFLEDSKPAQTYSTDHYTTQPDCQRGDGNDNPSAGLSRAIKDSQPPCLPSSCPVFEALSLPHYFSFILLTFKTVHLQY